MTEAVHLQAAGCDLVANVVRSAGTASLKVTGTSMLPAIRPGDVLRIRRRLSNELRLGQIVLYTRNGRLIAHRIISISGKFLITRGDSLQSVDPPVRESEVVGSVDGILRNRREVDARRTTWTRALAWMLQESETFKKVYLHFNARRVRFTVGSETVQGRTV
jgi:signal peptidase